MEKKRKNVQVVIAHPIPEEQQRIASILKKDGPFRIRHMTCDGLDCLREVLAIQPDLLIMDAVLDKIDGMEVLRRLKEFPQSKTKCLMLSTYGGYVKNYASFLGADFCLVTPCADSTLIESVRMLLQPPETTFSDKDIYAETARILRRLGVPERLKAHAYTIDGVRILIRDPELVRRRQVVKELYGTIAQHFDASGERVERTMRTLTTRLFSKGNAECLAQYFSPSDLQQGHMNNTDFLTTLAYWVKKNLADNESDQDAV